MYLLDPAERFRETLLDLLGLTVYTPAALGSTYMLLMVCEELIKSKRIVEGSATSHSLILGTIVGEFLPIFEPFMHLKNFEIYKLTLLLRQKMLAFLLELVNHQYTI